MTIHSPPAFCPVHGFFPATAIGVGAGAKNISFIGCRVSCPQCGRMSEVIPGSYDAFPDRLNVLVDPSISKESLAALKALVEQLQRNEITPEQAKAEAERIEPKAAGLFDVSNWSDQAKATLYASIIGAIAVVSAAAISRSVPSPKVVMQPVIERVVKEYRNSTAISRIPIPMPRPKGHR